MSFYIFSLLLLGRFRTRRTRKWNQMWDFVNWQVVSHCSSNERKFHMHWGHLNMFFRNYWAHYTKETKTIFKTVFKIHKCAKCWPVWSSSLWSTKNFCCVFISVSWFLGNLCVSAFLFKASLKIYEPLCNMFCLNYRTIESATVTKTFDGNNDIFTVSCIFFLKSEWGLRNL